MKYFLVANDDLKIIAFQPENQLIGKDVHTTPLYTDNEVVQIMSRGAHLINDEIIYPPSPGMVIVDGEWAYSNEWIDSKSASLSKRLSVILGEKLDDAASRIRGIPNYSAAQKEVDLRNYNKAKNGDFDDKTNTLIISKHKDYWEKMDRFIGKIEATRKEIKGLIESHDFERAESLLSPDGIPDYLQSNQHH